MPGLAMSTVPRGIGKGRLWEVGGENNRGHGTGRRSRPRSEQGGQLGSELPHGP